MFQAHAIGDGEKPELYRELGQQLEALLGDERDAVANAANAASLIYDALPDVNWVGFYFLRGDELVLGPFQGKPACVRIPVGKGVCGAAAAQRASIRVEDVLAFPGHIACDTASRSEIVVPLISGGRVWGVLDIDSPTEARFDVEDQEGIERLAAIYLAATRF
ncbi:MAG TPA: GAF domain-containing protein [Rhizomicrobium sp.]|nr:GAF domain-containing protein [Rhizomicrobium sp.]